jgi:hypothetical protein
MNRDEILSALGEKPMIIGIAKLLDYKFAYNKRGSKDGTGKANIYPCKNVYVYGVTYELIDEQMKKLDIKEDGYVRICTTLLFGGKKISAVSYKAKPNRIDDALRPSKDYRNKIIQGAIENKLPKTYIKKFIEN